jgi:hypothetical protein
MGTFQDEVKTIASDSVFTTVELESLFKTDDERRDFLKIRSVLVEAANTNEATKRIVEIGTKGIEVLVKLAKYALTA